MRPHSFRKSIEPIMWQNRFVDHLSFPFVEIRGESSTNPDPPRTETAPFFFGFSTSGVVGVSLSILREQNTDLEGK